VEGRKIGILDEKKFSELKNLVSAPMNAGIEELEKIQREEDQTAQTVASQYGFRRHYLRVPNYLRIAPVYSVEIKISHKQRAVGNQAMIYVNLPLIHCESETGRPFIGRLAERLEKVHYIIGTDNSGVIYDTVVAFAIASVDHRNDLKLIFDRL
jgi:hypothetical protein